MASRYDNRATAVNNNEIYSSFLEKRNVKFIVQFRTGELKHPSPEEIRNLELIGHVWTVGDRYYKLADQYYKDPSLWWIIAWFNQRPTESHLTPGDVIQIPQPLDLVLNYLDV
tara:strand:- start:166 stop:504 length:339 start_codon:yes stop_codon:yes gene_type:complete